MSKLTESFIAFLLEKHKKTGQKSFIYEEYKEFPDYEKAIADLSNRCVIEECNDILGTIIVHLPEKP